MNNSKMMQISNPMLIGAMELLKKDKSPESIKMFMDEVLHARFLAPVVITPEPEVGEDGKVKLTEENKISIPMIPAPDGKKFFLAYTDMAELNKMGAKGKVNVMGFTFTDYAVMVAKSDEDCDGFVINPQGNGPIVNKAMVAAIMNTVLKRKQEKVDVQQPAEGTVETVETTEE